MKKDETAILEFINVKKIVTIGEICTRFGFSESTSRRAVKKLADAGRVQRHRGGAMSNLYAQTSALVYQRFQEHMEEKERIARNAAQHVRNDSTVILMGGSTVCRMCKYLKKKTITVITNSLLVYEELKDNPTTSLVLLGGRFNYDEMEVGGMMTNSNIHSLRADSLFMGAYNFHPQVGFTTPDMETIEFHHLCFNAVNNVFMLVDSSKLGTDGAAVMATCDMVNYIISDTGLSDEAAAEFEEKKIKVLRV